MSDDSFPLQTNPYPTQQNSNDAEQGALNEMDRNDEFGERPPVFATPYPDPTPDTSEIPAEANIFDSVSGAYQQQIEQGTFPSSSPDPSDDGNSSN